MTSGERRYGPAEVREILRRVQRPEHDQAQTGGRADEGLSERELLETAREVGYTEAEVRTALVRYEGEQELVRYEREVQQLRRRGLSTHAIWYLVLNGLVAGVNLTVGPPLFFWIPLLLWGLFLLLHVRGVLFPDPDRLREQAQQRQTRQRLKESSQQLGHALGRGAAELMEATARRIEGALEQRRR